MDENLRNILYYPLGLIPSIFFSLRFILQWIRSEKLKISYVDSTFWRLSLVGNAIAASHYFIQVQYIFLFFQVVNAFIAWRNLNLMKTENKQYSLRSSFLIFLMSIFVISLFFYYVNSNAISFELLEVNTQISWHFLGALGAGLFASRFWIQWLNSERHRKSHFDEVFWILSISGGALTIIYSVYIKDLVIFLNYAFGMIPYTRNLILVLKSQKVQRLAEK